MKKSSFSILFIGMCFYANSQSNTLSGGGDASGSGGSVSYSIGQIDYSNSSGSGGSYNQGVQQPYEYFSAGLATPDQFKLSLYPNPTSDYILIESLIHIDNLHYQLTDMNGKILLENVLNETETVLSLKEFAAGTYQLNVLSENHQIELFTIIKH